MARNKRRGVGPSEHGRSCASVPAPARTNGTRAASGISIKRPAVESGRKRRGALLGAIVALTVGAVLAPYRWGDFSGNTSTTRSADTTQLGATAAAVHVGRDTCAGCHANEVAAWRGSDHDLAMQTSDEKSVLGDFANAKYAYAGITSTFSRRDGKFYVNTDGPDGKLADYEIRYTFGVRPLQQYLIELPGGRMQALSIAWDSRPKAEGGQRWFHLYPGQNIKAGDWLHWTSGGQNWNFTCAECHSTNLRKGYDANADVYKTTWSELNVSCEACHGPASRHVAWAKKEGDWQALAATKGLAIALDERKGVTWLPAADTGNAKRSAPRTSSRELDNLRALPRPRGAALRRLRAWQAGARYAPACAARRQPLLERRPDARGGLQLGLVRAESDARAGRDLFGLPRSPLAQAARTRQRGVRAVPSTGDVRRDVAYASRCKNARRRMHRVSHADGDVHGRRSAPRSLDAHPPP
jgi:hypothetical protein